MHVKRFADAKPYDAPNHRNYTSLRLFGAEAGGTKGLVFGYSHFQEAARGRTPLRRKKSISSCAAS
jgi:hypothetical protein